MTGNVGEGSRVGLLPQVAVSVFCADLETVFGFYRELLDLPEAVENRSEIYRELRHHDVAFGFHADAALDILAARDRWTAAPSVSHYPTFTVARDEDVELLADCAVTLGGRVMVHPYLTYYDAWQVVLADPEQNMFRVHHVRSVGSTEP